MRLGIFLILCLSLAAVADEVTTDLEGETLAIDPMATVAANFIGIGYDILEGNPDGGSLGNGGVDPGLKLNRHILQLTYKEEKRSSDLRYIIPDQTVFASSQSCVQQSDKSIYNGARSYQKKFRTEVTQSRKNKVLTTQHGLPSQSLSFQRLFHHFTKGNLRRSQWTKYRYRSS